eukprot:m.33330 g.33330  ORF g.33330 m.33330 type:complete len:63 (+) comp31803_c0_seq1:704-892(+)
MCSDIFCNDICPVFWLFNVFSIIRSITLSFVLLLFLGRSVKVQGRVQAARVQDISYTLLRRR